MNIDAIGIVTTHELRTYAQFMRIISNGVPENLGYLVKNGACRQHFEALMPNTQSVVCCAVCMPELPENLRPYLARFCAFGDYHADLRAHMETLAQGLCEKYGVTQYRICVDSAPILERELAVRAGLGSIGYNRMVIHPKLGSYVALGEILVDVNLTPYAAEIERLATVPKDADVDVLLTPGKHHCCALGHRRCTAACPTGALSDQGYDMHRCLAYWTTQHKGEIPEEFARAMGSSIWGCDRCQMACPRAGGCPQNQAARMAQTRHSDAPGGAYADIGIAPEQEESTIEGMKWSEMLLISAGKLRKGLEKSAMGGAHPYMVQRNLCIVIGNLGFSHYEKTLLQVCETHTCDWVKTAAKRALAMFDKGRS